MPWISSEIHYKRVDIYKETIFGRRVKLGYELTKPLRYKYKEGVFFVLDTGYIWDGSSYPKWIQWLVGKISKAGSLAASALHDVHDKIPTRYVSKNTDGEKTMGYTEMSIPDGAKFYSKLLIEWPDKDDTVTREQSFLQLCGLLIFQPIYSILNQKSDWKKVGEIINN